MILPWQLGNVIRSIESPRVLRIPEQTVDKNYTINLSCNFPAVVNQE
jgi:hypothetical protein